MCSRNAKDVIGITFKATKAVYIRSLSKFEKDRNLIALPRDEEVQKRREECLLTRICSPSGGTLGVVMCVNRLPSSPPLASTMFSGDEAAVLETIMQAAAPQLDRLTLEETSQVTWRDIQTLSGEIETELNSPINKSPGRPIPVPVKAKSLYIRRLLQREQIHKHSDLSSLSRNESPAIYELATQIIPYAQHSCHHLLLERIKLARWHSTNVLVTTRPC